MQVGSIIGGLLEERVDIVNDKTPILGNIPMIGRFFQSDALRTTKKAIVIFVKAELVDPTGQPWRKRDSPYYLIYSLMVIKLVTTSASPIPNI